MSQLRPRILARSYLFAPGDNEKLLAKVFSAGADAVVLDLEDAVAPANKAFARALIQAALQTRQPTRAPLIYVRINAISTPHWQADLAAAVHACVRGIRIGKAESLSEIQTADNGLTEVEEQAGIPHGALRIVPVIESAVGVLNAAEMARHPRVEAFSFGAADFVRDINAEVGAEVGADAGDEHELPTLFARSQLVLVSRAAGLNPPIASVYTRLKDPEGLRANTVAQRRLGFFGRSCIHPAQLPIVHEVFTPSAEELAEAQAILSAFAQAQAAGAAVATLENGQFIDAPIVERAQAVVGLAAALPVV